MSKRSLTLFATILFAFVMLGPGHSWAKITKITIEEGMQKERLVSPYDEGNSFGQGIPFQPGTVLDSPGEVIGTTHYDYQTNGSSGNRIAWDSQEGVHVAWMNGIDFWSGDRWVYYNFKDETGVWFWPDVGTQVNTTQGGGYTQLSVLADGRAIPAYHSELNALFTCIGRDALRGFGSFLEIDVPQISGPWDYYWPYEAIDRLDRIHLISSENPPTAGDSQIVIYTRSDDDGDNWIDPVMVDTLMDLSTVVTASRVSDKVCIALTHPRDLANADQFNNDMCYYESTDGVTWDFNGGMVNVTNYQTLDTIRAYTDCDAIYDYDDNLHLLWNTPYYDEIGGLISEDACFLWHWSEVTGINLVADGWWESSPGAWNRSISKMSLGVDQNSNLYALWTQFSEDDKSAMGGLSNGELYMTYSTDGGATWRWSPASKDTNITDSPTPDCFPGECDSDHWSSLAEEVDDYLHITYINDKDAGGMPQTEGVDTENPVMYLQLDNPYSGVVEDETAKPRTFVLMQNYPNPFNASTTIEYHIRTPGRVKLAVYNLRGELVQVLLDETMKAGNHSVTWEAGEAATGVYYYRLATSEGTISKRMVLLK
jgi:hypothetical protein